MLLRNMMRPMERCLGMRLGGGDVLMWQAELKPHATGDFSIAVVQANNSLEDQGQVVTSPSATFVGVYDGHGGPEASRFVSSRLFPHLHKFASEQGGLSSDAIKKAFESTEEEFLHLVKHSWLSRPKMASVGSCCLVGLIADDTLYVANLGDSRAVLGKRGSDGKRVVAERLSTDHNAATEEVRKELTELHPDDSHIVVHTRGVWRVKGIIQVSRSIGDVYLKKPEYSKDPLFQQFVSPVTLKRPVMTAEPQIRVRKLKPQDRFVIFASDGLWEHLTDEAAVEIVFRNPRSGIAKRLVKAALTEAAKKREMRYEDLRHIKKGVRRHFHDDITVVVIYLDQQRSTSRMLDTKYLFTNAPPDVFSHNSDDSGILQQKKEAAWELFQASSSLN
ncbi:Phosphatase 2C family protein [Rhynchospora pubera]|uniref:protein-serine/threonine phosphatase n=1 Tax=Rhynchospora pubera TaxID=906938 RepID=A0AAV8H4R8_9POAL|nr:Phosphatase 2C family protein [Rhynchospora pubera]KAJ4800884.1 Phosphatase 2C family protein [Rhynchospora pubera]KAJ4805942.1 Phosphatase 2C family protein [Rhynchospora pubera]KAJ4812527.1 Phosphatase 2C family protein [Rhynchospora pubera]